MDARILCLCALPAVLAGNAFDVTIERSGNLQADVAGGFRACALVNYDNWKGSSQAALSMRGEMAYELSARGRPLGSGDWAVHAQPDGSVLVTNRFVLAQDVAAQACGTRIYLPYANFAGMRWEADGKSGVFPTNTVRAGLFSGKSVRSFRLFRGDEIVSFAFPEPRVVNLSNDAAWCDSFSLRLQRPGTFRKGEAVADVFSVSVGRKLTCGPADPVVARRGPDWIPLTMWKGVEPGGATDFSSWALQDAPAGKHGWLKRVGDHFEFARRPGEPVRFYGVNLVSSCCWPERKEDADDLVARLVRSGYNTVRLHHFECAGGITSGTDDPSGTALNPVVMDRMDYLVSRLVAAGIYVTIDLYSYRTATWKSLGFEREGRPTFQEMKPLIHLTDAGYENWRRYAENLLTHVNPYTGRAYRDEPGLPLICLVNEGGLRMGWSVVRDLPVMKEVFGRDVSKLTSAQIPEFDAVQAKWEARSLERMVPFLRGLGVKALLTDLNNGPFRPEMDDLREKWLDYCDNHFYVDHPHWLGVRLKLPYRNQNRNYFDYGESPLDRAARVRVPSMPYTVTEWNFSGPAQFRHQGGLLTAATAAEKSWDGLWCFTWAHGLANLFDKTSRSGIGNFDVLLDPIQQANERALVALYLRGDAARGTRTLAKDAAAKRFTVSTARTRGGAALAGGGFETDGMSVALTGADAAVWATSVDGLPLDESTRVLLTHATDVQNEGMRWADAARTIVIARGGRPILARAGRADVALAAAAGDWSCWALETDGRRRAQVPVAHRDGRLRVLLDVARDPDQATLLYELVRR